jgi:ubiquinone/menaquinone biosynthesis C-methylase UbiE
MENSEWYVDWFNSPYYHLLYNNRNDVEAKLFINNLCSSLRLQGNQNVWDLACGKGRHALVLNQNHLNVIGTDLSENSISEASKSANKNLNFQVHDMRLPFKENYFDAVFNLFTSIGYFKNFDDNYLVFKNVALSLKENGYFVVDFFNAKRVVHLLKPSSCEFRNEINFNIQKKIEGNQIIKRIEFNDGQKVRFFEESVSLFNIGDFENFALNSGLTLYKTYGNYALEAFDENLSDRLIIIFKK